jgi:hypothetical protein
MKPQPVTSAQQLTPHDYKRLLSALTDAEPVEATEFEPLGQHTSIAFHAIQLQGVKFFAYY